MPSYQFTVRDSRIDTQIAMKPLDRATVTSSGLIDFGSGWFMPLGAPRLNADGDAELAPNDYPAPGFRKNSLIGQIGPFNHQLGTLKTITAATPGNLILFPNDSQPTDNSQGWVVTVDHTPALPGPTGDGLDTGNGTGVGDTINGGGGDTSLPRPARQDALVPVLSLPASLAQAVPTLALLMALIAILTRR